MVTATRLPGIQFEVVAPPVSETLVRMDIAAFVGFAASGPLHLPVMVEDIVRFEEIFGNDLVLASAADSNEPVYAYLPSAVRAFFRNGGRRCWVIRVADVTKAETGLFPLPGLFLLESGALTQAQARARSQGSWSDSTGGRLGPAVPSSGCRDLCLWFNGDWFVPQFGGRSIGRGSSAVQLSRHRRCVLVFCGLGCSRR